MKTYGQFCPLAQATQLLCERWTLIIVRELIAGSTRFGELRKGAPLLSPTLLSSRLKQLADAGVIEARGRKGSQTYHLTPAGLELRPVVELLGAWGHRWVRSDLGKVDLDAGLLMWDMRRSIDKARFPDRRVVVQFEFPDAPKGSGNWWLVSDDGEIDLCRTDNGFEVDIVIRCSLKKMTEIWTCQLAFDDAVRRREVKVTGDARLAARLQGWLQSSALSRLGARKELPRLEWGTP